MDVFVSASLAEGMSNSIMEAMAAGRVVVASDVGDASLILGPPASAVAVFCSDRTCACGCNSPPLRRTAIARRS